MLSTEELQRIKNAFGVIGNDPVLNTALESAYKVAPVDITALIIGESGVGKDVVPRIIHTYSRRRQKPYLAVNCGAIAEGIVDSELFGHVKGAYTGATETRKGYFEEADGGTLFLDEVAELPLPTQAKLLRVLQSGEYIRVGSSQVMKCDVRVIAATNVNLESAVKSGKFRADLYYRLNAAMIYMPPLRERTGDIHILFRKFLNDFADANRSSRIELDTDAVHLLQTYSWPGNIRELKNVADRLSAFESTPNPRDRQLVNAKVLSSYLKSVGSLVPAGHAAQEESGFTGVEKDMILRFLYQLKAEVDALKETVYGKHGSGVTRALTEPYGDMSIVTPTEYGGTQQEIVEDHGVAESSTVSQEEEQTIKGHNRRMIIEALERNGGNRKKTAAELGIAERTLYRKLEQYGLK